MMQWGLLALFVVACLGFAGWIIDDHRKSRQRRIDEQAAATTQRAREWMAAQEGADRRDGQHLKMELERLLADGVSDTEGTRSALDGVTQRLNAMEETTEANKSLAAGKQLLDDGKVDEALVVLNSYIALPAASHREEAIAIVSHILSATSEQLLYEALAQQDDATLQRSSDGETAAIGGVTHSVLLARQRDTAARVATRILDERAKQRREEAAASERHARVARAQSLMQAAWDQRRQRLAGRTGPAVPRDDERQLASASLGFMTWMLTQKTYEPPAVRDAIDSFNTHLHPVAESGDSALLATALEQISPEGIAIIDDAIADSEWGRIAISGTQTHGALWLRAWESAFELGVLIREKPRPPEAAKPGGPMVFLNDRRCPRTRGEMNEINKQTLATCRQELEAARARGPDQFLAMMQAADFLGKFSGVYQSGRKDLIVASVQQVSPPLEAGIRLLFDQTEFGNCLVLVAESDEEVRFLTYVEMWDRATQLQFR